MRKSTKSIIALLTLITAGAVCSPVYAANITYIGKVISLPIIPVDSSESQRGKGDINKDKTTDLCDLICLSQYLLGDIDLDESALIQADITKDGKVDITDLPALKMMIMTPDSGTEPLITTNYTPNAAVKPDHVPDKAI